MKNSEEPESYHLLLAPELHRSPLASNMGLSKLNSSASESEIILVRLAGFKRVLLRVMATKEQSIALY